MPQSTSVWVAACCPTENKNGLPLERMCWSHNARADYTFKMPSDGLQSDASVAVRSRGVTVAPPQTLASTGLVCDKAGVCTGSVNFRGPTVNGSPACSTADLNTADLNTADPCDSPHTTKLTPMFYSMAWLLQGGAHVLTAAAVTCVWGIRTRNDASDVVTRCFCMRSGTHPIALQISGCFHCVYRTGADSVWPTRCSTEQNVAVGRLLYSSGAVGRVLKPPGLACSKSAGHPDSVLARV
jgi:hypothetical protein